MNIDERARTSFDHCAEAYAAHRPDYPDVLFDDIMTFAELEPGAHALEIGAGTGIASRPFLDRGLRLTLVEPSEAMAAQARRYLDGYGGIDWQVKRFEDVRVKRGRFQLVYAAASMHWIHPEPGFRLAAEHVGPEGPVVVLGNAPEDTYELLQDVYAEHAPELAGKAAMPSFDERVDRRCEHLESTGDLEVRSVRTYPWRLRMPAARYVGMLASYSDHAVLPEPRRTRLLAGLEDVLSAAGGADRQMIASAIHLRAL